MRVVATLASIGLASALLLLAPAPLHAQDELGRRTYVKYCSQCHGVEGDGQGAAAPHLLPKPRDFTTGRYKLRTTPSGQLPTDSDLERVIRLGMPYSSMPAWPNLSDPEVEAVVQYIKTFSEDFSDPEYAPEPIALPAAPAWSEESATRGREVYEAVGCAQCHGETGRGEGPSAPTLVDDKGRPLKAADLTHRWTFRGGPTREDIFRTFSTGLNGTPMPSYFDSLEEADRWALTDYVYSLGDEDEPGYGTLVVAAPLDEEVDLSRAAEIFAEAPTVRFPLVGQIMEPGRQFSPSTTSLQVQAVYDDRRVAFRVRWHDIQADTAGSNSPTLEVTLADEPLAVLADDAETTGGEGGGFWGEEAEDSGSGGDDFWGEEAAGEESGEEDFWGEPSDDDESATASGVVADFSDAVALQLPARLPEGIVKPYFLFGDSQNPVDVWFLDLAENEPRRFEGRGGQSLSPLESSTVDGSGSWAEGEWSAVFVRDRRGKSSVSFAEGEYVPVAFSVWDGLRRERGNRRALTQWFYVYLPPRETPSVVGPMARAAFGVFGLELLAVVWIRRRHRNTGTA
jgi:cbb3-type cytochrome c oxidase subunit III